MITEHGLIITTHSAGDRVRVRAKHVLSGLEAESDITSSRIGARRQALERLEALIITGGDAGGGGPIA